MIATLAAAILAAGSAPAQAGEQARADIRAALFEARPIHDGAGVIALEVPERVHDAAPVPVTITGQIPQTPERYIQDHPSGDR